MNKKYELNVVSKDLKKVIVGEFSICLPAYTYITSFDDLREAYEQCNDIYWLNYLFINIDITNSDSVYNYAINKANVLLKKGYIPKSSDYKNWEQEWIDKLKHAFPWGELIKYLLKYEIIKEI